MFRRLNPIPTWKSLPTTDKIATWGLLMTIVFGIVGYRLGRQQVKLSEAQIMLAQKQADADVKVAEFGKLLDKTDALLYDQTKLLKRVSEQLEVQRKLLNLSEQQKIKEEEKASNARNDNIAQLRSDCLKARTEFDRLMFSTISGADRKYRFSVGLLGLIETRFKSNPIVKENKKINDNLQDLILRIITYRDHTLGLCDSCYDWIAKQTRYKKDIAAQQDKEYSYILSKFQDCMSDIAYLTFTPEERKYLNRTTAPSKNHNKR